MIDIILFHWATYLLLAWLMVIGGIGAVNLWPKTKPAGQAESARFALRGTPRDSATVPHHER